MIGIATFLVIGVATVLVIGVVTVLVIGVATVLVTADAYVHLRSSQLCPPLVVTEGGVTELVPWTRLGLVPYSAVPYEWNLIMYRLPHEKKITGLPQI